MPTTEARHGSRERGVLTRQRRVRQRRGRFAEYAAAAYLALKGYRIVGRRQRTAVGEIDLIAVRGRRIAFVEVKQRLSLEAAEASISDRQRRRVRRAADRWLAKNDRYQAYEIGFDIVFLVPGRLPRHLPNGL
jgi:putative endonuclease